MIRTCLGKEPRVAPSAYVDASAPVIGDVDIGESCSIWCNATLRGDISSIQIGDESNIQDNCCLHVDWGKPLHVGKRVVVGHSVTLHGCEIGDELPHWHGFDGPQRRSHWGGIDCRGRVIGAGGRQHRPGQHGDGVSREN